MTRFDPFELMPVLPKILRDDDSMRLMKSSPGYEITESDTKYQVAVDVPGIQPADLTVNIDHPMGSSQYPVLHISGTRKVERKPKEGEKDQSTVVSELKFEKHFTIGSNVDIDKMTANIADGVLVLSAPKKEPEAKSIINIPITDGPTEAKL
jgi:HSP20 family protein